MPVIFVSQDLKRFNRQKCICGHEHTFQFKMYWCKDFIKAWAEFESNTLWIITVSNLDSNSTTVAHVL